jgi:small-conductance mechanosensitive channel
VNLVRSLPITPLLAQPETGTPDFVREHFPALVQISVLGVAAWQALAMIAALAGAVAIGAALSRLFHRLSRPLSRRSGNSWFVPLSRSVQNPIAGLVAVGAFDWAVHLIDLVGHISVIVDTMARQLLIGAVAWLLVAGGGSLATSLEQNLVGTDEFSSRGARTQLRVAYRVSSGLVVLIALALILSGFDAVRNIGVSLLASAGIASVVIGIAAQKTLGGFVAGIQLSITQPIRIGDTVVVDTEFGTVEQIHLTFVVLRLWDLRRLMVPVSKFLEQSFQNWTRVRTNLLGTAELWVDYTAPLATLREELARVCKASKLWDGQTCVLQVTGASERSMQLRMLVSADGPGNLFDLRCEVREKVIALLQSLDGGIYLPHDRTIDLPEGVARP